MVSNWLEGIVQTHFVTEAAMGNNSVTIRASDYALFNFFFNSVEADACALRDGEQFVVPYVVKVKGSWVAVVPTIYTPRFHLFFCEELPLFCQVYSGTFCVDGSGFFGVIPPPSINPVHFFSTVFCVSNGIELPTTTVFGLTISEVALSFFICHERTLAYKETVYNRGHAQ